MGMMKIGGKSTSGNAVPMSVDNNGVVFQKHVWETEVVTIANEQIRDTNGHIYPNNNGTAAPINVSDYALVAIRIYNSLDQELDVSLSDGGNPYKRIDGTKYEFRIPALTQVVLTADDIPCLNMLPDFCIRCSCNTAPTDGKIYARVIKKR